MIFVCFGCTANGVYGQVTALFFDNDNSKEGTIVLHWIAPVLLSGTLAALLTTTTTNTFTTSTTSSTSGGDTNFKSFTIRFVVLPLSLLLYTTIHRHLYNNNNNNELSWDEQVMEISNAFAIVAVCAMGLFLLPVARHGPIFTLLQWNPSHAIQLHMNAGRILIVGSILHGCGHVYRWINLAGENIWTMILPPMTPCWEWHHNHDHDNNNNYCHNSDTDCTCNDLLRNLTGVVAVLCMFLILLTSSHYIRRYYYSIFYWTHIFITPICLLSVILHWNKSILYMAPSLLYYVASSAPVLMEQLLSSPIQIHSMTRIIQRQNSTTTTSTSSTSSQDNCIVVAITIHATEKAVNQYSPGQYVKVYIPEILSSSSSSSSRWYCHSLRHPFTINKVPGQPTQLRILCRVINNNNNNKKGGGSFTKALANYCNHPNHHHHHNQLPSSSSSISPLRLYIDGYYGTQLRMCQVLQHDVVVMVAAGIGITPYLSILGDLMMHHHQNHHTTTTTTSTTTTTTQKVVFHWICREKELIEYIKREYFDPILQHHQQQQQHHHGMKLQLMLMVHHTGTPTTPTTPTMSSSSGAAAAAASSSTTMAPFTWSSSLSDEPRTSSSNVRVEEFVDEGSSIDEEVMGTTTTTTTTTLGGDGVAFEPSQFATGKYSSFLVNLPIFFTFGSISWVGLYGILVLYDTTNHHAADEDGDDVEPEGLLLLWYRGWVAVWIVSLGIVVALLGNAFVKWIRLDVLEHTAVRGVVVRRDGTVWSRVNTGTTELGGASYTQQLELSSSELPLRRYNNDGGDDDDDDDEFASSAADGDGGTTTNSTSSSFLAAPTYEERHGRPTLHELLRMFDDTDSCRSPGLFFCGPSAFMTDLRHAAEETCRMRRRGRQQQYCLEQGPPHKIAMYGETFEL